MARYNQDMCIGITGATGAVGFSLVRHLIEKTGLRVQALCRKNPPFENERLHWIQGDLFNSTAMNQLVPNADVIIHLAAETPGTDGISGSAGTDAAETAHHFFTVNGLGTSIVSRLAEKYRKPMVHMSSIAVYFELNSKTDIRFSGEESLPVSGEFNEWLQAAIKVSEELTQDWLFGNLANPALKMQEFLQTHSLSGKKIHEIYGLSKYLGECLMAKSTDTLIFRLSDVYGPGHESRGLMTDYLFSLLENQKIEVNFGHRNRISFIYMEDVVAAIIRAAEYVVSPSSRRNSRILHLATPEAVTEKQLANILKAIAVKVSSGSEIICTRDTQPACATYFDTTPLCSELGIQDFTRLDDGILKTLEQFRNFRGPLHKECGRVGAGRF